MFYNYLTITLRNIKKHKAYSFINIFGLAASFGIEITQMILKYIGSDQYEEINIFLDHFLEKNFNNE